MLKQFLFLFKCILLIIKKNAYRGSLFFFILGPLQEMLAPHIHLRDGGVLTASGNTLPFKNFAKVGFFLISKVVTGQCKKTAAWFSVKSGMQTLTSLPLITQRSLRALSVNLLLKCGNSQCP